MVRKLTYEPGDGDYLNKIIKIAKKEAVYHGDPISVKFNGVDLITRRKSCR